MQYMSHATANSPRMTDMSSQRLPDPLSPRPATSVQRHPDCPEAVTRSYLLRKPDHLPLFRPGVTRRYWSGSPLPAPRRKADENLPATLPKAAKPSASTSVQTVRVVQTLACLGYQGNAAAQATSTGAICCHASRNQRFLTLSHMETRQLSQKSSHEQHSISTEVSDRP